MASISTSRYKYGNIPKNAIVEWLVTYNNGQLFDILDQDICEEKTYFGGNISINKHEENMVEFTLPHELTFNNVDEPLDAIQLLILW